MISAHWVQTAFLCGLAVVVYCLLVRLIVSVIRTRSPLDEMEFDERVWELEED